MQNQLIELNYEDYNLTVIQDEKGNPWWIAKEVCEVLDLSNVTEATKALDPDELTSIVLNSGEQGRKTIIINEPGLYSLILRSRKPEAKKFKRWITHEVLPKIRKDGYYNQITNQEAFYGRMIEKLTQLNIEMPKINDQVQRSKVKIKELDERVDYLENTSEKRKKPRAADKKLMLRFMNEIYDFKDPIDGTDLKAGYEFDHFKRVDKADKYNCWIISKLNNRRLNNTKSKLYREDIEPAFREYQRKFKLWEKESVYKQQPLF